MCYKTNTSHLQDFNFINTLLREKYKLWMHYWIPRGKVTEAWRRPLTSSAKVKVQRFRSSTASTATMVWAGPILPFIYYIISSIRFLFSLSWVEKSPPGIFFSSSLAPSLRCIITNDTAITRFNTQPTQPIFHTPHPAGAKCMQQLIEMWKSGWLLEEIEYTAVTSPTCEIPLIFFPPWIKYYYERVDRLNRGARRAVRI